MQLNRQTDYALRVLVFLAISPKDTLVNLDTIAEKFNIVRNHLTKIITKLAKLNYITTQRGNGGGIRLKEKTLDLSLFEVMNSFESTFKSINCAGLSCPIHGVCRLESILSEAENAYTSVLQSYKLKNLIPSNSNEQRIIFKRLNLD